MNVEWVVINVTALGSPDRTGRDNFGMISDIFGQFRPLLWLGSHFVILESSFEP